MRRSKIMNKISISFIVLAVMVSCLFVPQASAYNVYQNQCISIVGGENHSVALKSDGSLWSWGNNSLGQLGYYTISNTVSYPSKITAIDNAVEVAAGSNHTLALARDGSVWAWGNNSLGQLAQNTTGLFSTVYTSSPRRVYGIDDIISISAGIDFSVALRRDGTVWAWGDNLYGQIGISQKSLSYVTTPFRVIGLDNVTAISAGGHHVMALKNDGTVWSWGDGYYGQLGDSFDIGTYIPVKAQYLSGITAIKAGATHSIALTHDGLVFAWGRNNRGQLGDGTYLNCSFPVCVKSLDNIISISAGYNHSVALKSDGTVWTWGYNALGELGDGSRMDCNFPLVIYGANNSINIGAGQDHTFAIKQDGSVYSWGYNAKGQLGDGTYYDNLLPMRTIRF